MNPQLLPAQFRDDVPAWMQTVVAFLAEKERRSGSRRTVEGYARMLWPRCRDLGLERTVLECTRPIGIQCRLTMPLGARRSA